MLGPLQLKDFWRVNSYGYPNPFNSEAKSQEAWATFLSFFDNDGGLYTDLKSFWASPQAPRRLDSHAVESWKATFEEFGLLYVISRSNRITITPAGRQFRAAAEEKDEYKFVWIGLNLLFRYPVKGPPRGRSRGPAHSHADILPYRFLYSCMRDLGDYFWWTELERIICRVFLTTEARPALDAIRGLRANPSLLDGFPLPVDTKKGAFYNSLNQVANHAGLNHLVLGQDNESEHYGPLESRRRHVIKRDYLNLISIALGDSTQPTACESSAMYVDRLPAAGAFSSEQEYFNYLGAEIPAFPAAGSPAGPRTLTLAGDTVFVLKLGEHYTFISSSNREMIVEGAISTLCRIARSHRVIVSADLSWTYLVAGKEVAGPNSVRLSLRRARPITNVEPIEALLGAEDV